MALNDNDLSPPEAAALSIGASDPAKNRNVPLTQEERDLFFTLSLDMLCISNADGYFKWLNPAFTTTLGWSLEELTTRPFLDFVHPDDQEATLREVDRQVVAGEIVFQFENRYAHKDGSWRVLSWKSIPGPNGSMFATARDVTAKKAAEVEIVKLNEGLVRRAHELETARAEAERANAAKSTFLSHMSHELRTPLNAVIGFAQLLEMRSKDPATLEDARAILNGGRLLLDLINEVLDLASIEAGKLSLSVESLRLADITAEAVDIVRPIANGQRVSIFMEHGENRNLYVKADRQRLLQIIINLLTNAAKYNREDGSIEIRFHEEINGKCRVTISDTGPGIDDSFRDRLFIPFERGNQAAQGTGLGLALSHRLAGLMAGELVLLGTSPEGTTFAVDLPGAEAPAEWHRSEQPLNSGDDHADVVPLNIVYIEDNLANVRLMEAILREIPGATLLPAMQASVGWNLIESHLPDLVLLDVHLPDGDGLDVLKKIKSNPKTAHIPVVVLSADATERQIRRLMDAGAKSYLTKPLELKLLFSELEDATNKS